MFVIKRDHSYRYLRVIESPQKWTEKEEDAFMFKTRDEARDILRVIQPLNTGEIKIIDVRGEKELAEDAFDRAMRGI